MIIDTQGYTVTEWMDYMADELSSYGPVPKLLNPDDWQAWALFVVGLPGISSQHPPNPYSYDKWNEWGDAFNRTVNIAG